MAEKEEFKNKVSDILDKLSLGDQIPLDVIMEQITKLKIDLPAWVLVEQIFEKAIATDDPKISKECAHLCKLLWSTKLTLDDSESETLSFRKVLLSKFKHNSPT